MLELYKNIKKFRQLNDWSQDELAKKIGYTDRSIITKIEQGKIDLPQSKIALFADIFNVTQSELMGNDGIDTELSKSEWELIKEYRNLDTHGKDTVSYIIESESKRSEMAKRLIKYSKLIEEIEKDKGDYHESKEAPKW